MDFQRNKSKETKDTSQFLERSENGIGQQRTDAQR